MNGFNSVKNVINPTNAKELLSAIIEIAIEDFHTGSNAQRADAVQYFRSEQYQRHLKLLEMPADWLPESVQSAIITIEKEPTLPLLWAKGISV